MKRKNSDRLELLINQKVKSVLKMQPLTIERSPRLGRPGNKKYKPVIMKLVDVREEK